MELTESLTCECNGKTYATKRTFKDHMARDQHRNWELKRENHDLRVRLGRAEHAVANWKRKVKDIAEMQSVDLLG